MSEPKRYGLGGFDSIEEMEDGSLVLWDDYEKLLKERDAIDNKFCECRERLFEIKGLAITLQRYIDKLQNL